MVPPDALVGATALALDPLLNRPGAPKDQLGWWETTGLAPTRALPTASAGRKALLAELAASGSDTLGVTVEWARLAPAPGQVDDRALEDYATLLEQAAEAGLRPVVTLQHRSYPGWMGAELWLTPGAPDRFADHARRVVARLAPSCRHWVTLQSPGRMAREGWVTARQPPFRRGALADAWVVLDNLLTAHRLVERELRRARPDAVVALGYRASDLYEEGAMCVDLLRSPRLGVQPGDLGAWLAARRAERRGLHPPASALNGAAETAAGALSPFGRRPAPGGWRDLLRRPSPRRVLRVLGHDDLPGPEAAAVVLDAPGVTGASAVVEWCRVEARSVGLPLWLLLPAGGRAANLDGRLVLASAARAGARLEGWLAEREEAVAVTLED